MFHRIYKSEETLCPVDESDIQRIFTIQFITIYKNNNTFN